MRLSKNKELLVIILYQISENVVKNVQNGCLVLLPKRHAQ